MIQTYKQKQSLVMRCYFMKIFKQNSPQSEIVVIEKLPKSKLPQLQNMIYDLNHQNFEILQASIKGQLQKNYNQTNNKAKIGNILLTIDNRVIPKDATVKQLYKLYKESDDILYINYHEQQEFTLSTTEEIALLTSLGAFVGFVLFKLSQ